MNMMTEIYFQVRGSNGQLVKLGNDHKFFVAEKAMTVAREESAKHKKLFTVERVSKHIEEVWYANPVNELENVNK